MMAIVEKENPNDYIAMQYVIENKWELHISRNENVSEDNPDVWIMKRKTPEGQMVLMQGKRKVFDSSKEKFPKIY